METATAPADQAEGQEKAEGEPQLTLFVAGEAPLRGLFNVKATKAAIGRDLQEDDRITLVVSARCTEVHFIREDGIRTRKHVLVAEYAYEAAGDVPVPPPADAGDGDDGEHPDGPVVDGQVEPAADASSEDSGDEDPDLEWKE